jgi:hypothetical protein
MRTDDAMIRARTTGDRITDLAMTVLMTVLMAVVVAVGPDAAAPRLQQ